LLLCELAAAWIVVSPAIAQEAPFQSRQVTPTGEYTFGIEGPAVDAQGNLYVVNFGKPGTVGKLAAGASQSELFAVLPEGSIGNAIRFDPRGRMFVAEPFDLRSYARSAAFASFQGYRQVGFRTVREP